MAQCDIETPGPICFGAVSDETMTVFLPPALAPGLRGFWSFDKASVVDHSDFGNHGFGLFQPAPAFGGQGSAAFFRNSYIEVQDSKGSLPDKDFSYTFWLYLVADNAGPVGLKVCPLIRKGVGTGGEFQGAASEEYGASPAILYDRNSRRLRIELLTTGAPGLDTGVSLVESFESNARLRKGKWVHIALVRSDEQRQTSLFVNGIPDSTHKTQGHMKSMRTTLFLGGDALTKDGCNLPMYLDEVKVYDRPLDIDDIQAEASSALAGIEPNYIRLGCINCQLEMAERTCPATYHLCSSLELHIGAYQVARSLGWLDPGAHVWSRSGPMAAGDQSGVSPAPAPAAMETRATDMETRGRIELEPGPIPMEVRGQISLAQLLSPTATAPEYAGVPVAGVGLCCADSA